MKLAVVALLLATASPALADPTDRQRAKALYESGSAEYKAGHYERAIELFQSAYDLSHAPALLFNIAQAYRLSGACAPAVDYYKRSLAEDPNADNKTEIEDRLRELAACAARPTEPTPPPPTVAVPPVATPPSAAVVELPKPRPVRWTAAVEPERQRPRTPLVVAASGVAAGLAGGILLWRAHDKFAEVQSTCPCAPGTFSGWQTATRVSYGLIAAGSAAAIGGAIWWYVAPAPLRHVSPTSSGVQYTMRF